MTSTKRSVSVARMQMSTSSSQGMKPPCLTAPSIVPPSSQYSIPLRLQMSVTVHSMESSFSCTALRFFCIYCFSSVVIIFFETISVIIVSYVREMVLSISSAIKRRNGHRLCNHCLNGICILRSSSIAVRVVRCLAISDCECA